MNSPIRDMAGLRAACIQAKQERGITNETIDAIAGLPERYTSKVLSPNPVRMVGHQSLGEIMGALGKMLVMVDDPEMIERVKGRWKRSKRAKDQPVTFDRGLIAEVMAAKAELKDRKPQGASMPSNIEKLAVLLAQMTAREKIVMGASKGGKRRAQRLKKATRQRIASHAARRRWAKARASGSATA